MYTTHLRTTPLARNSRSRKNGPESRTIMRHCFIINFYSFIMCLYHKRSFTLNFLMLHTSNLCVMFKLIQMLQFIENGLFFIINNLLFKVILLLTCLKYTVQLLTGHKYLKCDQLFPKRSYICPLLNVIKCVTMCN